MSSPVLALAEDPYILRPPLPDDLVVQPYRISPGNTHANSRVRDDVWSLGPLTDQPGAALAYIHWKDCPTSLRGELVTLVWTLVNGEHRPTSVQARGRGSRPGTVRTSLGILMWLRWARWLDRHGVHTLADVDREHWLAFANSLRAQGVDRNTMKVYLSYLSDLWEYDQLTVRPAGILRPPWDTEGLDDHLPEAEESSYGENTTEPLDPRVVGPLLVWSIRLVEDLADDILAAWNERIRITAQARANRSTPAGAASLHAYLRALLDDGAPLPTATIRGKAGLARFYIAERTGASLNQLHRAIQRDGLARVAAEQPRPGPCPLTTPVTGLIDGRPWRTDIGFDEVEELWRHLGTAAATIIMYLTGMRPQEVQALRSGCCPDPTPASDGTTRHLIHSQVTDNTDEKESNAEEADEGTDEETAEPALITGRHYKNVIDDGNHVSAGEIRTVPWVAITPVVNAIRVLERMVPPGELLLSSTHHDPQQGAGITAA